MSNILTYIPTYITLTLQDGYIAIYNDSGIQQYYQNTDGTIELPYSATGTWSYKIARYGYKLITGTFTIDRTIGGTVTINAPSSYIADTNISATQTSVSAYNIFSSTQNIYDYLSYYRTTSAGLGYGDLNQYASTLDLGSKNIILDPSAAQSFTYDGTTFSLKGNVLSGAQITTTGNTYLSGSSYLTNIVFNSNIYYTTVASLTSLATTGTIHYNTNTPFNIIYTNCTVNAVQNDGSATINIKRINSTITTATDPEIQNYTPTYISLTLQSGYIAIYNDSGIQQYYQNTDGTIELPYSATGTWSYKIARYGYKLITGTFTINRTTGGTVAITPTYVQDVNIADSLVSVSAYNTFSTTQNIYDYLSYYRTTSAGLGYGDLNSYTNSLDVGSNNIILFDAAIPSFSYDGSTFIFNSTSLSGASIKTNGTVTISGNSGISNISVAASATDKTPNDLANVVITGALIYNTNSPASITYTNCTIGTVVNIGTGNILIKRVNSSINNATDPEISNYAPTIINVNPLSGSVGIYDNTATRQYFITEPSSLLLTPTASGSWHYKIARYGYYSITQYFDVNPAVGATININPNYITDLFITETNVALVTAYGSLGTAARIHDYMSYYQTTSAGIDYGDIENETFGALTFTGGLILDAAASLIASVSSNYLILKSEVLTDSIILGINDNFYQQNGNVISDGILVRAANLDSELLFTGADSITLFQTINDRDTNSNPGPSSSGGALRFKYGATTSGVTLSGDRYARVVAGGIVLSNTIHIAKGHNVIDFGTTGQLSLILQNQGVINRGVQKSSILVPHTGTTTGG